MMQNLLNKVNKLHVNYEVLTLAILNLSEEEQVKVNVAILKALGLPLDAADSLIQRERQIKVDDVNEYDGILDAFTLLEKVTKELDGCNSEALAEAQMFLGSTKHE